MNTFYKDVMLLELQNMIARAHGVSAGMLSNVIMASEDTIKKHGDALIQLAMEGLLNAYDTACQFYFDDKVDKAAFDKINKHAILQLFAEDSVKKQIKKGSYAMLLKWRNKVCRTKTK